MALAVARAWQEREPGAGTLRFDAAGTRVGRGGLGIDARALATLQRRGYAAGRQRSRQVTAEDLERADRVLAMDADCLQALRKICPLGQQGKLSLFLAHAAGYAGQDVPDPYYGPAAGFEKVLDLCEIGVRALLTLHADEKLAARTPL